MDDSGIAPVPPPPHLANANMASQTPINPISMLPSDISLSEPPLPASPPTPASAPVIPINPLTALPAESFDSLKKASQVGTGKSKESPVFGGTQQESGSISAEKPITQMEEIPTQVEIEKKPELAGYVEKVEREAELPQAISDDYTNQVLLKSNNPQNVTVTLPLTEEEVVMGLHQQVWESIRWLAEWCVRQIKLLHGKVRYRDEV